MAETGQYPAGTVSAPERTVPALALNRGDVVRIRDERWTVAECAVYTDTTLVTVVGCDRTNRGIRARYLLPFEPVDRLAPIDSTRIVSRRRWTRLAGETLADATPSSAALRTPASTDITILPYQLEPALAVTSGVAARILIADDVGLGKTIQAGLIAAELLARGDARVLVLCPASLRDQWRSELTDRFRLSPVVLDSASLERSAPDGINPWGACPLVLASIDYVKRPEVMRALEPLVWDLMVVDEAHGVARLSDRHTAAASLAQRARTVVLLTATPHSGDDTSFGRLAAIGDHHRSFPLLVFRRRRSVLGSRTRHTRWMTVRQTTAERHLYRALMAYVRRVWRSPATPAAALAMIVLTRRASSSSHSLERTLERRLALLSACPQGDAQLALPLRASVYEDDEPGVEIGAPGLANRGDEQGEIATLLALARRAAENESKVRALLRLLRRCSEPAIVFTEYRDTLETLDRALGQFGTRQLHGGMTGAERSEVIQAFTSGACRLLLATDAASEGLNLHQRCRLVVHLEVPWTPSRIEQRVGRVDRIGQTRTVHQMLFVARDTVEESRVADIARRTLRAASALDDLPSTSVDEWTIADHVINDAPWPGAQPSQRQLPVLVTADLQEQAEAEAARLLLVRQLARPNVYPSRPRPFVARYRRCPGAAIWAMWVEVTDSAGMPLWNTIVGAMGHWQGPRVMPPTAARAAVDLSWPWIRERLADNGALHEAVFTASIRTAASLALKRETAIADAIEHQHARLAVRLVQKGLFDRRAERSAQSQRDLLEQALGRCRERRAALERLTCPAVSVRPAFALVPW